MAFSDGVFELIRVAHGDIAYLAFCAEVQRCCHAVQNILRIWGCMMLFCKIWPPHRGGYLPSVRISSIFAARCIGDLVLLRLCIGCTFSPWRIFGFDKARQIRALEPLNSSPICHAGSEIVVFFNIILSSFIEILV